MKTRGIVTSVLFVVILAIICPSSVFAEESKTITLKFATPYSPKHPQVVPDVIWFEKIEKATNGRLQIKPYFGGTLMGPRESYDELQKGVADIATLTAAYSKSGFDIHKGTFPFMYGLTDLAIRLKIFRQVADTFPEIYDEFKAVKILRLSSGSAYQLMSRKPIRTIEDMKGLSVKATGLYVHFVTAAGAEGVPLPMSETFIALQKGTIDALLAPIETLKTFRFAEVAPFVTILNISSTPYPGLGMNMDAWNNLPTDIQKIFIDSREKWEMDYGLFQMQKDQEGVEFAKTKGVQFIEPSPEAINEFYEILKEVCLDSGKKLDSKGFHGTAIFNEMRRLIKENSQ